MTRYVDEESTLREVTVDFADRLIDAAREHDVVPVSDDVTLRDIETSVGHLRRSGRRQHDDVVQRMTLTEIDGVLRWELGGGLPPTRRRLRRGGDGRRIANEFVTTVKFKTLPPNEIRARLIRLDERLTRNQGLREVSRASGKVLTSPAMPASTGRILLLIHGTFSDCETMLSEMRASDEGRLFFDNLLAGVRDRSGPYAQVLAFNHPTLSTTPVLNAVRLASLLRTSHAEIDVIAHSRGGLVTRWWRELADTRQAAPGRVVLVGSPLGGTSLAAPAQLRRSLDLLTNYARALHMATRATGSFLPMAAPLIEAVGMIVSVIGSVLKAGARTPLLDAAIALIPGLAAQSRESTNAEILELRSHYSQMNKQLRTQIVERTAIVRSNFESEELGWRFWRVFRRPNERLKDWGADLVFPGHNDLVVDTDSMGELADDSIVSGAREVLDFGTSTTVHHTNYLQVPATMHFIADTLRSS